MLYALQHTLAALGLKGDMLLSAGTEKSYEVLELFLMLAMARISQQCT